MEVHKQLLSKKISNIEHIDLTLQNESFNCNVKSICSLLDEKNKFNYLSLQFFAEGDGEEEGAEGQEYVEEGTEGQEYVEETPSVPMPENSLISIARDKAQEIYDKKSHKKDVGQDTGQEVADKTKGVTKEVKDTAGGDWAKVVSEAKDSVNNKLRKNTSNSGNKNDVKQADKSIENSEGDETYDVIYEDVEYDAYLISCRWSYKPTDALKLSDYGTTLNMIVVNNEGRYEITETSVTTIDAKPKVEENTSPVP